MTEEQDDMNIDDIDLSFWSLLDSKTSSVYDFIPDELTLTDEEMDAILKPTIPKKPAIRPYVSINDLNNSDDEPYLNKPKPAIEAGIVVDF